MAGTPVACKTALSLSVESYITQTNCLAQTAVKSVKMVLETPNLDML
jgi:hypothetical protein